MAVSELAMTLVYGNLGCMNWFAVGETALGLLGVFVVLSRHSDLVGRRLWVAVVQLACATRAINYTADRCAGQNEVLGVARVVALLIHAMCIGDIAHNLTPKIANSATELAGTDAEASDWDKIR